MAREFSSSSDLVEGADTLALNLNNAATIAFWLYPNWAQTDNTNHIFWSVFFASDQLGRFQKFSDNNLYFGFLQTTWRRITVSSYTLNQSAWNQFTYVYDPSESTEKQRLYLNGSKIGTVNATTVSNYQVSGDPKCLGNEASNSSAASVNLDGRMAEYAIWLDALQADDVTALQTCRPSEVRPDVLNGYWPIWGDHDPEIDLHSRSVNSGDFSLTVTDAPAKANHAPVTLFSQKWQRASMMTDEAAAPASAPRLTLLGAG